MIGTFDTYYAQEEVSNSNLSEVAKLFYGEERIMDLTAAYRFGNLIDAMVTEDYRCDHLARKVDDEPFSVEDWTKATTMRNTAMADPLVKKLKTLSTGQQIKVIKDFKIIHEGIEFSLPVRCKYDLFADALGWGADLKSTVATSEKQFAALVEYFDYDRQGAWYMDLSGADRHLIFGISKVDPRKIFKVYMTRDSEMYKIGRKKYESLAFLYYTLFGGIKLNKQAA